VIVLATTDLSDSASKLWWSHSLPSLNHRRSKLHPCSIFQGRLPSANLTRPVVRTTGQITASPLSSRGERRTTTAPCSAQDRQGDENGQRGGVRSRAKSGRASQTSAPLAGPPARRLTPPARSPPRNTRQTAACRPHSFARTAAGHLAGGSTTPPLIMLACRRIRDRRPTRASSRLTHTPARRAR